jgi:hypothetical protein
MHARYVRRHEQHHRRKTRGQRTLNQPESTTTNTEPSQTIQTTQTLTADDSLNTVRFLTHNTKQLKTTENNKKQ